MDQIDYSTYEAIIIIYRVFLNIGTKGWSIRFRAPMHETFHPVVQERLLIS
jgi:hypothetical protein